MLKNYLTIAWRNFFKNPSSSWINVGGLAVGMAVALLIGLWIQDEYSYDTIPWSHPLFWGIGLGCMLVTGLIAGSYPALYLSSFHPVKVLKSSFKAGRLAALPRRALVVLQFTISLMLVIGTIIVYRQVQIARNRPLGYNRNGLLSLEMYNRDLYGHFDAIRQELQQTGTSTDLAEGNLIKNMNAFLTELKGIPGVADATTMNGDMLGSHSGGRSFSPGYGADSTGIIFNESAIARTAIANPVNALRAE